MHARSWVTGCAVACVMAALNTAAAQTGQPPAVSPAPGSSAPASAATGDTVSVTTAPDNTAPVKTALGAVPDTVIVRPGQTPAPESGDDVVCKVVPPTTGSRLGGGRECHKRREWLQRQYDAQSVTRHQETTGFVWGPKAGGH